jgi:hypothetical protein
MVHHLLLGERRNDVLPRSGVVIQRGPDAVHGFSPVAESRA